MALFNLSSSKKRGALSYDENYVLLSNERSEVKNKYIVRSRISEAKFREILKYFSEDIEVSKISKSNAM